MSEDKKELNENELDKVNGGGFLATTRVTNSPCDGGLPCAGSVCSKYDSCTRSIKK